MIKKRRRFFFKVMDGESCEFKLLELTGNKTRSLMRFEKCPKTYAYDLEAKKHIYSNGANLSIQSQAGREDVKIPKQDSISQGESNEVVWIHHNGKIKFARENFLKYNKDHLKKIDDEIWLIKYDYDYYVNSLAVGAPAFYEILTVRSDGNRKLLHRSFGEIHGAEFDEALGLKAIISQRVEEKNNSYSFSVATRMSGFSQDKMEGSLNAGTISKITEKITAAGSHSVEFVKTPKGGFAFGNASDGYIYLKPPVLYVEGDKISELITKGGIRPRISEDYLIIQTDEDLQIYSRETGSLLKKLKSVSSYRVY